MSKSALRVLEIMEYIGGQSAGCNHTTISQGLGIPKSSLTALLQDLHSKGYLHRDPDTGYFTIGLQVLWLANSYLRNLNLVKLGQPVVASVFSQITQFTTLAIPSGSEYVIICTETVPSAFGHTLQLGSRGPMHSSALGKAILAFSPQSYVDDILERANAAGTPRSAKIKAQELVAELSAIRKSGVARSHGEAIAGVDGFAAPVFNATGVPVASLGVGVPTTDVNQKLTNRIETALKKGAHSLSVQLGWQGQLEART